MLRRPWLSLLALALALRLAHGAPARAVSLQERQAEMLREKIKGLELRIMEMVRHSHENAAIAAKVHQWTGALLQVRDPMDLPHALVDGLQTLFDVPQAAVRVWGVAGPYIDADFTQGASEDSRAFATSLTMPFCGPNLGFEPAAWLAHGDGEAAGRAHHHALDHGLTAHLLRSAHGLFG